MFILVDIMLSNRSCLKPAATLQASTLLSSEAPCVQLLSSDARRMERSHTESLQAWWEVA